MAQDFTFERFSEPALLALFHARAVAGEAGGSSITPEHLLLGIVRADRETVTRFLSQPVEIDALVRDIGTGLAVNPTPVPEAAGIPLSERVAWILGKLASKLEPRDPCASNTSSLGC